MAYKRRRKEGNPSDVTKLGEMTTPFGVSTRAKTVALNGSIGDECYLHLRSRRLERFNPPHLFVKKARKSTYAPRKEGFDLDEEENVGVFKFQGNDKCRGNFALGENEGEKKVVEELEKRFKKDEMNNNEERVPCNEVEDSFGENDPDFENMERITRESAPSNFIMSKDDITTRMSSNKAINNATIVHQMKIGEPIRPSLLELELFFADAEKHCVRKFIK